jgi:pyrimidine-nucleoside phosphorylase
MRPQDIIAKKRDGHALTKDEIGIFIGGVCDGAWADYQISALVMAMFINGLNDEEQNILTQSMLHSGDTIDLADIDRPKADKHSTGGVGDKTSLIIAPLAAACGLAVPMISGRGLGHTGGTLDKLESIPGYNVRLTLDELKQTIKACGFAMAGQTDRLVPADKKLYAMRDATATVPYIPLIVASIMSKKLAENLDALALDVKTGTGAFMNEFEDAKRLAEAMCQTGNACGVKTQAVISDMNQPLGKYVGNSLEVYECLKIMRNEHDDIMLPTRELSIDLTARMLTLTGFCKDIETAKMLCEQKLSEGAPLESFRANIELQHGDVRVIDNPETLLNGSLKEIAVTAAGSGFINGIDSLAIGEAICEIGGGRTKAEDAVDHAVGYLSAKQIGDAVREGEELGVIFCRTREQADSVFAKLQTAYRITDESTTKPELIKYVV